MDTDANADAWRPAEDPSSGRRRKPEQTASSAAKKARLDSNSVALEERRKQGGRPPDDELTRPAHGEEKVNFVWSVFGLHVATDRVWSAACSVSFEYRNSTERMLDHIRACALCHDHIDDRSSPEQKQHLVRFMSESIPRPAGRQQSVDAHSQQCNLLMARWILDSSISANSLQSPHAKELFSKLGFKLPKRIQMMRTMDSLFAVMHGKLSAELAEAGAVAMTSENTTTAGGVSVHAYTAHYIDKEWNLKSAVLAVHRTGDVHARDSRSRLFNRAIGVGPLVTTRLLWRRILPRASSEAHVIFLRLMRFRSR